MSPVLRGTETLQLWDVIHRFCEDDPGVIADFDEARRVLTVHAGHDCKCRQYLAALRRTSEVLPRRTPGAHHIPHHSTSSPSVALLIRVAAGLDEWAERDRRRESDQSNYS